MSQTVTGGRIEDWFQGQGWDVFPFQQTAWEGYRAGKSGLVHAPTGFGKTFAAMGGPAQEGLEEQLAGKAATGLRVLWITPLKALANDTGDALQHFFSGIDLPWTVAVRHGDISSRDKARLRKQLPNVLITTPESLSLMLSYADVRKSFRQLRCIVCDEWHELMGSKRGVQTELGISRLKGLVPDVRVWGLSATIGNLDDALRTLVGPNHRDAIIVRGDHQKEIRVVTLLPDDIEGFPWAGHLGIRLVHAVVEQIRHARSTLVFTNTRSQAELWYQSLSKAAPDLAASIEIHHGSVDRDRRLAIEQAIDEGEVKAVVCTSSLDLGVDYSPVEQVVQVGSPKGIARLTQRAGRSGHQPGVPSVIYGVPTNALEILEFAAARSALGRGEIEPRISLKNSLDVLLQHVITVALSGDVTEAQLRDEILSTAAFNELNPLDWTWVLGFAKGEVGALTAYPEYRKVCVSESGALAGSGQSLARMHRMSIGTITGDSEIVVRYQKGGSLGMIEEGFISRLNPGDVFNFAGKRLELIRFRQMTAYVKNARRAAGVTPSWAGGRSPLSSELADAVAREIQSWSTEGAQSDELRRLSPLLTQQQERSLLPGSRWLLTESCHYRSTWNLFAYPFAGRLVNEGLAALVAFRLSKITPLTLKTTINDYGFSIQSAKEFEVDESLVRQLFSVENLQVDLLDCMNSAELARRQFREIARVAGLVFQGYPGQPKSARNIQMSSGLLYDTFARYDTDNRLLLQAERELLDRQLEHTRLLSTLQRINEMPFHVVATEKITPFAFPLWAESLFDQVSSESWSDRVARIAAREGATS
ncbi:MAG: ligase-associated DNA damage response DEXH box helicase [Verrucomicrobiota bacterium]